MQIGRYKRRPDFQTSFPEKFSTAQIDQYWVDTSSSGWTFLAVARLSDSNVQPAFPDLKNRLAPQALDNLIGRAEAGLIGTVGGAVVIDVCGLAGEEEFSVKRASQFTAHFGG